MEKIARFPGGEDSAESFPVTQGRSSQSRSVGFSKSAIQTRYGENADVPPTPGKQGSEGTPQNESAENAENAENADAKTRKMRKMRMTGFNVTGFR